MVRDEKEKENYRSILFEKNNHVIKLSLYEVSSSVYCGGGGGAGIKINHCFSHKCTDD